MPIGGTTFSKLSPWTPLEDSLPRVHHAHAFTALIHTATYFALTSAKMSLNAPGC